MCKKVFSGIRKEHASYTFILLESDFVFILLMNLLISKGFARPLKSCLAFIIHVNLVNFSRDSTYPLQDQFTSSSWNLPPNK